MLAHQKFVFSSILILICLPYLTNSQRVTTKADSILYGNISVLFVADDLRRGLIPAMQSIWKNLKETKKSFHSEDDHRNFWTSTFHKSLKPFHDKIKEIDQNVASHPPNVTLNPIVGLTKLEALVNATNDVTAKKAEWLETVKVGWVKVESLMLQIDWKYEWNFDRLFSEEFPASYSDEMESIVAENKLLHFAWNEVEGRGNGSEKHHLNINELPLFAMAEMKGTEDPKSKHDLFHGLKALLNLQEEIDNKLMGNAGNKSCIGNETMAGGLGKNYDHIPVYVLLHLLNAEFKYYIIRSTANLFLCVHNKKCDFKKADSLQAHLDEYYEFYFGGIVKAFQEKSDGKNLNATGAAAPQNWRWRCDSRKNNKLNFVEDVTFTRFIDFETGFVAEERDLSLIQSCRETCDSFDGGFTKIPCGEGTWSSCLGIEGDFDCLDKVRHNKSCPDPERVAKRPCPHGISCQTTGLKKAKVCMADTPKRYINWIDTEGFTKKNLGTITKCGKNATITYTVDEIVERSEITKFEPQKCEVCLCKCFEPMGKDSHRYVSLEEQVTNLKEGYVVVGARFRKIQNVIHISIAQGKLSRGSIDQSTISWSTPPAINSNDTTKAFRLGSESRKLLLDDLFVPAGHMITGLRFNSVQIPSLTDYEKISHEARYSLALDDKLKWVFGLNQTELRFEIQVTAINEKSEFNLSSSYWLFNQNTSISRKPVNITEPDIPTLTKKSSQPISQSNGFVTVQSSSLKKDAAQTPVPFFDAQDLIETSSNGISPLASIGLFMKGQPGYGGFLALRFQSKSSASTTSPGPAYDLWKLVQNGVYENYTRY